MKRAIAISFNWITHEMLHQTFEGAGCADSAAGWVHSKSFIIRDFPAKDGWEHWAHWNKEAGEERGARIAKELCETGCISESVPR